ncbi:MAG: Coenzyme F420:L-glutamate ligase, partial [Verrucomicrobiota bacterium]
IEAIFHRRAVRHYAPTEVDAETVQKLLLAAVQAPSAMNQQPWLFGVFHGRKRLLDYSERAKRYLVATYPTGFELHPRSELYENPAFDIFHGANTLIVVYAERGQFNANEDCCLAAANLMLAAYGLGLGTCPIGFARFWLDRPETKRELNVPEHYTTVFPLVLGYPAGPTPATPRDEPGIVSWQWDAE